MKVHLLRSTRTLWCGRSLEGKWFQVAKDKQHVTCKTCIKADAAEQTRNK